MEHPASAAAPATIGASATGADANPIAQLVARLPRLWPLCLISVGLVFLAQLLYGANSDAAALALAATWCVIGAFALVAPDKRDAVRPTPTLVAAGLCFAGVLAVGVLQLVAEPFGLVHPLWTNVEGASALTIDRDATAHELVKLASLSGAFTVGMVIGASDVRARFFVFSFLIAAAAYSAWAFFQHVLTPGQIFGADKPYHFDRLTASFLSANSAATVFGVFSVLAATRIARALKESGGPGGGRLSMADALARKAGTSSVLMLLAMTCLFLTGSRAGVAAGLAALMLLGAWEARAVLGAKARARGAASAVAVLAIVLIGATVFAGGDAIDRLGSAATDATVRLTAFETHWRAILAAPLFGHGLGGFSAVNDYLLTAQNHLELERLNALHNVYLQWLEEAGLLGAGLMFACIGLLLTAIWRGLGNRRAMRTWLRGILAASGLICAHGLVDYGLQVPSIAWLWSLWLGVGFGISIPTRRTEKRRGRSG